MRRTVLILAAALLLVLPACRPRQESRDTTEGVLARMRADTAWIRRLDSLAQTAVGPGARCQDPVKHTFLYGGRTWIYNQDWGGVLEIPSEYVPEDDPWQTFTSFHGTRAWSPDSLFLVSCYAGLQVLPFDEYVDQILSGLGEEGFSVQETDRDGGVLLIRACSGDGVSFFGRYLHDDGNGTEYSVSVQYPAGMEADAAPLLEMACRYPLGP